MAGVTGKAMKEVGHALLTIGASAASAASDEAVGEKGFFDTGVGPRIPAAVAGIGAGLLGVRAGFSTAVGVACDYSSQGGRAGAKHVKARLQRRKAAAEAEAKAPQQGAQPKGDPKTAHDMFPEQPAQQPQPAVTNGKGAHP